MSDVFGNMLRPVLDQVGKLWNRVDLMPVVRWGTVVAANPLRVTLDGDDGPLPFAPVSAIGKLVTGERIVCVEQHRRIIVVQSAGRGLELDWTTPTLSNGFTHHPSSPLQYRAMDGRFALRGACYRSQATAGAYLTLFVLPQARYFPSGQVRSAGRADAGQSTAVTNQGDVQMLLTAPVTGGVGLPVDGITWDY